jgi:hypothetical protein
MLRIKLFSSALLIHWDALKDAKLRLLFPLLRKIADKSMPFFLSLLGWKMATSETATKGYLKTNVCLLASRQNFFSFFFLFFKKNYVRAMFFFPN